jgi:bifunctional DNase/RNase
MNLIPARISHLLIEEHVGNQLVFLEEISGTRRFSIAIGALEAMALQRALTREEFARPLTHDLFLNALQAFDIVPREVRIVSMQQETFFAEIVLHQETAEASVETALDCRPSDALALAARSNLKILVNEELFATLG